MWRFPLALALALLAAAAGEAPLLDAAEALDDECLAGDGACALSALQMRAAERFAERRANASEAEGSADAAEEGLEEGAAEEGEDLEEEDPEDAVSLESQGGPGRDRRHSGGDRRRDRRHSGGKFACRPEPPTKCSSVRRREPLKPHSNPCDIYDGCIKKWGSHTKAPQGSKYIKTIKGHNFCINERSGTPYLIVPKVAVTGTEEVKKGEGPKWDWTFHEAQKLCTKSTCAQLVNPWGKGARFYYRSRNQLHVHSAEISKSGQDLSKALEKSLCSEKEGHWKDFKPTLSWYRCQRGKAAYFAGSGYPDVFTKVLKDYDDALKCVGVSVYKISCHKSEKWAILWTQGCSLEEEVFKR